MPAVVLDASVALSAVFPDEQESGRGLEHVLDNAGAVVPPIWPAEVLNALQIGKRRGRIDSASVHSAVGYLFRVPIRVAEIHLVEYAEQVLPLAERHGLSIYDASYLHLAMTSRLPLATLDRRLQAAAKSETVSLA